jgi:hypothetical protein
VSDGFVVATCTDTFLYWKRKRGGPAGVCVVKTDQREAGGGGTNLEELLDYEGCFDGRDAAGCDEENVCVSLVPISRCGEVPCHVVWVRFRVLIGPGQAVA